MAHSEIINKLNNFLTDHQSLTEESDVIYVLSRIRKILEIDSSHGQYSRLNFYCNWALHARIDRNTSIEPVRSMLEEFIDNQENSKFPDFSDFNNELRRFLKHYDLPLKICDDTDAIRSRNILLVQIFSDTPLEVTTASHGKVIITFVKPNLAHPQATFSVEWRIRWDMKGVSYLRKGGFSDFDD